MKHTRIITTITYQRLNHCTQTTNFCCTYLTVYNLNCKTEKKNISFASFKWIGLSCLSIQNMHWDFYIECRSTAQKKQTHLSYTDRIEKATIYKKKKDKKARKLWHSVTAAPKHGPNRHSPTLYAVSTRFETFLKSTSKMGFSATLCTQ